MFSVCGSSGDNRLDVSIILMELQAKATQSWSQMLMVDLSELEPSTTVFLHTEVLGRHVNGTESERSV